MSEPDIDTTISELMNGLMEFDMKQDLWDWPPILYLVGSPDPNGDPNRFRVHPIEPIGQDGLRSAHPVHAMQAMALTVALGGRTGVEMFFAIEEDEVPVALVLRHEAWGLKSDSGMTEEEMREWCEHNKIVDHPARVEVKMINAFTYTGNNPVLSLERGGEPRLNEGTEGRVPDTMKSLLEAMRSAVV